METFIRGSNPPSFPESLWVQRKMKPTFYILNFLAIQYFIAGGFFFWQGQPLMGIVYVSYGVSNIALSFI